MQLSNEIGRHAPASSFWVGVFPGFDSTTTVAFLKGVGKCPSARLAFPMAASASYRGRPNAFRKPMGSPSGPGAFQELLFCRVVKTSYKVISRLKGSMVLDGGGSFRTLGLGVTIGKNLVTRI